MRACRHLGLAVLAIAASSGCNSAGVGSEAAGMSSMSSDRSTYDAERRAIEESDIYRVDGSFLYVLNAETGLSILDVSDPRAPELVGRLAVRSGAGELYVRESRVFILFDELESPCSLPAGFDVGQSQGWSELLALESAPANPTEARRYCLPGVMLASRLLGDILYVVVNEETWGDWDETWQTWVLSFDVSDPRDVTLADALAVPGLGQEVHVTSRAIYLTQPVLDDTTGAASTSIQYVDIADAEGTLSPRGQITVPGNPMGRFHMDALDGQFRIVTYDATTASSDLHVVDWSQLDAPRLVGSLTQIAPGEELHATYFVGDRAYIVTYLRTEVWEYDPLWIVSLENPTQPEILGELQLPGWSDFVFPIGNRLVGVGRGDMGNGIGVALFDISSPRNPTLLRRLEFGSPGATSEANVDFRGVQIVEPGVIGDNGLVAVPFDDWFVTESGCEDPGHYVQLVDVRPDDLAARGHVELRGAARRALPIGDRLYAIDEQDVSAIDIDDRSSPAVTVRVQIGDGQVQTGHCEIFGSLVQVTGDAAGCSASGLPVRSGPGSAVASALAFLLFALALRRGL